MQVTFEWLETPWLLLASMEGEVTLSDYAAFNAERLRYLNAAYQRVYCIYDWSSVDPALSPEAFTVMLKTTVPTHPRVGVTAVVGNQTMLRMVTTSIVQQELKKYTQSATQVFSALEQALHFCRTKAALDREAEASYAHQLPIGSR